MNRESSARLVVPSCGTGRESTAYAGEPRTRSDSGFVQAVLNYLPVCLKDCSGEFRH